ncbi:iron-siderophore ABC transporter substrate-binding protein [Patulibacter sp. SYSU D01012]|uniref:ABC transporter substrate-binding protein n=1 Tax=Patulibacter sp. SYSU D01012 TaxID=2817381 RepID=UPI001B30C8E4|nr:iron-siderophore ABC transporter substrate-binding protein [Patulibacter sp. SYSU D01012]
MRIWSLCAVLASAVVLAACGGSDDDASSAGTTTAAAGAFPVTITDAYGTAKIERPPTRVAAIGFNEQDFVLALGVKPVAIRESLGAFDYLHRKWAPGANDPKPALVGSSEVSLEKVAAARPDLILGVYSFVDETTYGKLAKIAPTVVQPKDAPPGGAPWDQQMLLTGRALGREAQAKRIVADVNARFATARKEHPEFAGKELTVAFESGKSVFSLADDDLRQRFFTDLGFETPKDAGQESISSERLDVLDHDVLVLITDGTRKLSEDELFRRLKVAKEGRVIQVTADSDFAGALGYNSPLSRPFLLDQVVPQLAAAVDGDPATKVPVAQ